MTNTVVSLAAQAQSKVPVTFGQIFKAGDVPAGKTLKATFNGQPVSLQVDVKATNPDGSLRHAVLTALIPSIDANATAPLAISTSASTATGSPVTLSQLLATTYDASASLNIGGTTYTASARSLLQAAQTANACAPWNTTCDRWLSGPLASEWVVGGPVSAGGTANPNLNVYFDVRAYASTPGNISYVQTDIVVENDWAYTPVAKLQYTATLTSGSATYTSPALTQYAYTRWHQVLWWNAVQPQVYLQQDTQYIQSSLAISRYMSLQPAASFLAGLRQSCAPLDYCDQTQTMGNTGAQAAIGPLPRWTSVYIVDPEYRAYNWMLANTDALGAYSIHYRDQATGWALSIVKHPYVTIVDWSYAKQASQNNTPTGQKYKADLLPTGGTGNPDVWDNAHQPAESYVPYMVTGSYYYMSELALDASQNEMWPNETYRGFSQGLIDPSHSQVRGKAWTLREMADAAYLLPDDHPLKGEFTDDVNNSIAGFNAKYNSSFNTLGLLDATAYSMHGGSNNGIAPWQHNFITWSAGHAADLGFTGADTFRDWLAQFEIGIMTDWQSDPANGYCWLLASAYTVQVKDSSGNKLPSYTAIYAASFPSLVGLDCNSAAMVQAVGQMYNQTWQAGEMAGYPYSSTGYPANLQIGLSVAADTSLPNAHAAWTLFQGRSVQPSGSTSYNDYPNFALLPRSVP